MALTSIFSCFRTSRNSISSSASPSSSSSARCCDSQSVSPSFGAVTGMRSWINLNPSAALRVRIVKRGKYPGSGFA